jgi:IS30 family transposase
MEQKQYEHVSRSERDRIDLGLAQGQSGREIARSLGRSASTISREIKRNQEAGRRYLPDTAANLAKERRWRGCKIERDERLRDYITDKLVMEQWSPERLSGRMKLDNLPFHACHETIYRFIYSPAAKQYSLTGHLFKAKPRRTGIRGRKARKTPIPNRIPIQLRPEAVNNRSAFGHWEGDLVLYQGQRGNLLTLQERKSRLLLIAKNPSKHKKGTHQMIRSRLKLFPETARQSVTFDNGGEFADHEKLHRIACKTFFCDPYASWQKGGLEHANGRIRRFLPKNTRLDDISHAEVDRIQRLLNNMPMKCLGYKTPAEVFLSNINNRCTSI